MMPRDRRFLRRKLHVTIELPSEDDAFLALIDFDFGAGLRPVQMLDGKHFQPRPVESPYRQVFMTIAVEAMEGLPRHTGFVTLFGISRMGADDGRAYRVSWACGPCGCDNLRLRERPDLPDQTHPLHCAVPGGGL